MKQINKFLLGTLAVFLCLLGSVQAEAISSDSVMQAQNALYNKQQLVDMVSRGDVKEKLVSLGVDDGVAIERINAMTPTELAELNQQINDAPAGGIVGTVVTVLVVIAVLDLLGVTDVYPFIRPI